MKNAKKTLFSFTCILLITFSFTNCVEKGEKENAPEVIVPEQIVSVEDAKLMYDAYSARRKPLIRRYEDSINRRKDNYRNDKMKQQNKKDDNSSASQEAVRVDSFPVARYVYYDYQTIKDYLTYIEQEAKSKGIEISTLRFYFSNYPENMPVKNAKPRQNSIFIMPTITQDSITFGYFLNDKEQLQLLADDLKVSKTPFKPKAIASKVEASLLPKFESSITAPTYNFYQGKSYILNSGSGVPPPYQ